MFVYVLLAVVNLPLNFFLGDSLSSSFFAYLPCTIFPSIGFHSPWLDTFHTVVPAVLLYLCQYTSTCPVSSKYMFEWREET